MDNQAILALTVFLLAYALIISEKIHRTVVAMVGGVLVILLAIVSQEKAIHHVDFNTLGLLIGMMVLVNITGKTGVFNYLAIISTKAVKARPIAILVMLSVLTAALSALLDNVTTVLLMTPVIFGITKKLKLSPIPYLISEVVASNIGGTATLIGDPPNIMIGSAVKELTYMAFINNLAAISGIVLLITIAVLVAIYRKELVTTDSLRKTLLMAEAKKELKDKKLLRKCLVVLGVTTFAFMFHQLLHLESATVALAGAFLLLLITTESNEELETVFSKIEWPTIFFFIGLFIMVGGLVETGIIAAMGKAAIDYTGGDLAIASLLILWLSAIASAFVDNIPFVATMIPMIKAMGTHGMNNLEPLWWSLALGACFGGNGSIIGASANLIVVGLAEQEGHHISFMKFLRVCFPLMLLSVLIASMYVYWRYL